MIEVPKRYQQRLDYNNLPEGSKMEDFEIVWFNPTTKSRLVVNRTTGEHYFLKKGYMDEINWFNKDYRDSQK